jgi:hypothetical protein
MIIQIVVHLKHLFPSLASIREFNDHKARRHLALSWKSGDASIPILRDSGEVDHPKLNPECG